MLAGFFATGRRPANLGSVFPDHEVHPKKTLVLSLPALTLLRKHPG
jgi:hypothetical protein